MIACKAFNALEIIGDILRNIITIGSPWTGSGYQCNPVLSAFGSGGGGGIRTRNQC